MGRKSNQRKTARPTRQKTSNLEDLLLTSSTLDSFTERRFSPDSLRSLRKELKDAITQIYSKFIQRFIQIKDLRVSLGDAEIQIPAEELVIEKNYCNELTQKVKQLVHLDSLTEIYYTFCKSVIHFATQVDSELKSLPLCIMTRLSCIHEAYQVMLNSARELSKVTSGIFENQPSHVTCETVTKLAFFEYVLKSFSQVLMQCEENSLVLRVRMIEKELQELSRIVNGLNQDTNTHGKVLPSVCQADKSLDEIVSFINGRDEKKNYRRRRVSKASTAETSGSPARQRSLDMLWKDDEDHGNSMDKEIREFQAKLESTKPLFQRLKPSLSEEWLRKIRSQIIKSD